MIKEQNINANAEQEQELKDAIIDEEFAGVSKKEWLNVREAQYYLDAYKGIKITTANIYALAARGRIIKAGSPCHYKFDRRSLDLFYSNELNKQSDGNINEINRYAAIFPKENEVFKVLQTTQEGRIKPPKSVVYISNMGTVINVTQRGWLS